MAQGYGDMLKKAREEKNLKIADVNKVTKIDIIYLNALEEENAEPFEKSIYMRLFLRTYTKFLKIDEKEILALYEKMDDETQKIENEATKNNMKEEIVREETIVDVDIKKDNEFILSTKRNIIIAAIAAGVIIILLTVSLIVGLASKGKGKDESKEIYVVEQKTTIKVIVKAKNKVWMKAKYGEEEEEFFMQKGEDKKWEGIQKIVFLIGNAAGVEFIVNGDSIGVIGEEGEVINGLVFQAGKNWYIDRGQGFKTLKKPTPTPVEILTDAEGNTINQE